MTAACRRSRRRLTAGVPCVWVNDGSQDQLKDSTLFAPTLRPYADALSRVKLLASSTVREHIEAIHECVRRLTGDPPVDAARASAIVDALKRREVLEMAMRAELGIK